AHTAPLSGLSPAVTYHYRVKSRDAAGNLAVSGDFTFLTPAAPPPPSDSEPVGAWPLSEGSGTLASDASGNSFNGALAGGPTWIAGRIGPGLSLDGADDYVAIPHAPALDPYPITVAAWLRTTATGLHGVVNKYVPGSLNGYQIFLNGGSLCAWYFRDAANYVWDGTSCTLATPGFNDGQWHHVALVVDAAGARLYVDGAQKAARAWTGTAGPSTTTAELALGRYPSIATPYLPGAIDEVRVYNRALSASEIAGLMGLDTTPPILSAVAASSLSDTGATITWTTNEPADTQVEYGSTSAYGSSTSLNGSLLTNHSQSLGGLVPSTLYHYRVKSRDAAGNLAVSPDFSFTTPAALSPGKHKGRPVASWQFSEPAGTVAADSSGNGFDGTLVAGPARTSGPIGPGLAFDGADDYVDVPHADALDPYPVTVAAWLKTGATGLHGVVNKYLPGSLNGYQIFLNRGTLCAWYFRDASDFVWDGTSCTLATPGYSDGRWHHVAFVVDPSGGRLFVDGEQRAARAWTGAAGPATTTASLSLGRYPGTAAPFLPGALDDVRIYDRALGADEVMALYNPNVGLLGSWSFSEPGGESADDSSGLGFNGTILGDPARIAGAVGAALSFDGLNDSVEVPQASVLDPLPLTLAAWIRTDSAGLHGLINKYLPSSFNGYQIFVSGGSLCAWYFRDAANFVWDGGECGLRVPGFADGAWHHVAFVVDARGGRLYVDGVEKAARAWTGTAGPATTPAGVVFARYPAVASSNLRGDLDEVRLYGRALSEDQIADLREGSIPVL
ncbi:MAG TPA: LamG-like jellyroll fold domain-containing protein, partial [Candidatus Polarisedimenticolia bacterium]|nr:LamG-like jellyroll fold domain-containing protein [Candidatus Polarisedimenticolia bacterium]